MYYIKKRRGPKKSQRVINFLEKSGIGKSYSVEANPPRGIWHFVSLKEGYYYPGDDNPYFKTDGDKVSGCGVNELLKKLKKVVKVS